jgi:hypothetical protein
VEIVRSIRVVAELAKSFGSATIPNVLANSATTEMRHLCLKWCAAPETEAGDWQDGPYEHVEFFDIVVDSFDMPEVWSSHGQKPSTATKWQMPNALGTS